MGIARLYFGRRLCKTFRVWENEVRCGQTFRTNLVGSMRNVNLIKKVLSSNGPMSASTQNTTSASSTETMNRQLPYAQ